MKWSFLPKDNPKPRYMCVNADESEPGTYKDRVIIENDPHQLIEAIVVSCHAIRSKTAYIYIRGEFHEGARTLEQGARGGAGRGLRGQEHPGHRGRRRDPRPPRRGLVRVRRGDGAHREPRGQARPAPHQAALPGGGGPLRLPDHRQQRRDPGERAPHPRPGGRSGSRATGPRRTAAPSSTRSAATSSARAATRRPWAGSPCATSSTARATRRGSGAGASSRR